MIVVLAILVGLVFSVVVWRGTRGQRSAVMVGARGGAAVLSGAMVIGALFMVTDPGDNLVITEAAIQTTPSGGRTVSGSVENQTDRAMSPVRVEIDFINSESRIIDRLLLEGEEIAARGRWEFVGPVKMDEAVGFRARVGSPDNVRPAWLGGCGSDVCRGD